MNEELKKVSIILGMLILISIISYMTYSYINVEDIDKSETAEKEVVNITIEYLFALAVMLIPFL